MATVVVEQGDIRAASAAGPIYLLLFPVPAVCFLAALVTDIAYAQTEFLMWLHFSQWLIAAGLLFGVVAAIVLLIEAFAGRAIRGANVGWAHLVLFYAALIVEAFNALVHTSDGWTAVVPIGMTLSVAGAILVLAAVATLFLIPARWIERRRIRA